MTEAFHSMAKTCAQPEWMLACVFLKGS